MTIKPKAMTKARVGSKRATRPEIAAADVQRAKDVKNAIAKLRALSGSPDPFLALTPFNIIFGKKFLNVGECKTMGEAQKVLMQRYKDFLEMVQNDLAVALYKIKDDDITREILDAVSGIKCFSVCLGNLHVKIMPDYIGRELSRRKGPSLNRASVEKHTPVREKRREIIKQNFRKEELSNSEECARIVEPVLNAEMKQLQIGDPDTDYRTPLRTIRREIAVILKE